MRKVSTRRALVVAPANGFVEVVQSDETQDTNPEPQYLSLASVGAPAGYVTPIVATGVNQGLSGTGALAAIALDSAYTGISTVGGAATTTLAEGLVAGHMKSMEMLADAGDCVITVAGSGSGTIATITLNDVGDACTVMWNGTGWLLQTNVGCALSYN
jgi:hypothetical protein